MAYVSSNGQKTIDMFKYYIKFGLRNIKRQPIYSIINIFGLAIGFALFLIISLYVQNEYAFDKHNQNYDHIYRMEFGNWCVIPPGFAHILNGQIPEIKKITRTNYNGNALLSYDSTGSGEQSRNINLQHFLAVDSTFFEIFDAEFISGSAQSVLREPMTVVLTESISKRLFGNDNPLNKVVKLDNKHNLRVDGVIRDLEKSHLMADAFYSVVSNNIIKYEGTTNDLQSSNYLTYFLFNNDFDVDIVRTKIFDFFKKYKDGEILDDDDLEEFIVLRPLEDIYFFKEAEYESGVKHGNKPVVNAFIIIAIFILFIAGINFINLTTARAALRAKEVGIKKVVGSTRPNLIFQFLSESILICLIAMLIALTLLQILLPEFNNIALTNLKLDAIFTVAGISVMLLIAMIIGIISGLYPAVYLSYFNPVSVMKGETRRGKSAGIFRKMLISFQFIIATILISGTLVVNQQIDYLKNKDLGFKKENIINIILKGNQYRSSKDFKQKLLQNPNVLNVSFSHGIPGNTRNTNTFAWDEEDITARITSVDEDFFDLYDIQILEGSTEIWKSDSEQRKFAIINETFAKEIGWEDPVGKMVYRDSTFFNYFMSGDFKVVGVYRDYHIESLHTPVAPMAICHDSKTHWQGSIKINGDNISETLDYIEKVWLDFAPEFPFQYTFLDQKFDQMYKSEERMQKIAINFSILAVFIACLGLFGLSAFMTQRRFKEIGIRKVLGSSIIQIVSKLSIEFSSLILVANIIAVPVGWYTLNLWLQDYPYRINIQWWVFLVAAIIIVVIALLTVSFHSFKAATSNPVDAIRHE